MMIVGKVRILMSMVEASFGDPDPGPNKSRLSELCAKSS